MQVNSCEIGQVTGEVTKRSWRPQRRTIEMHLQPRAKQATWDNKVTSLSSDFGSQQVVATILFGLCSLKFLNGILRKTFIIYFPPFLERGNLSIGNADYSKFLLVISLVTENRNKTCDCNNYHGIQIQAICKPKDINKNHHNVMLARRMRNRFRTICSHLKVNETTVHPLTIPTGSHRQQKVRNSPHPVGSAARHLVDPTSSSRFRPNPLPILTRPHVETLIKMCGRVLRV